MTSAGKTLTTNEYSKLSGISVSTVTKMLRAGKLNGQKINGKWAIDAAQSPSNAEQPQNNNHRNAPSVIEQAAQTRASGMGETYDIDTFTNMTYLTEKGVRQWVKNGRLSGRVDPSGNITVDADNLDRPEFRHLIRK